MLTIARLMGYVNGPQRIATILTAGNILSLLMSLGGTLVLTWLFSIEELGHFGVISTLTMLCAPFITFRLDLSFERLGKGLWAGLVLAVHGLAFAASITVGALAVLLVKTTGLLNIQDAFYLGLNIFLFCSHSFIWSWLVARRALGISVLLQVSRAFLSFGLPALFLLIMSSYHALLLGMALSQACGLIFLFGLRDWSIRSAYIAFQSVWRRQRHLFLSNSLPVFLNLVSVQGMQPLTFYVYGSATAGVFWLAMRLVFIPTTVFCDPIRRATYARHPDVKRLTASVINGYSLASWIGLLAGCVAAVLLWATSDYWMTFFKEDYHQAFPGLFAAIVWVGVVVGNAPTSSLSVTLKLHIFPTVVEVIGIIYRGFSVLLGLAGVTFSNSFFLFFLGTFVINLIFGSMIRNISKGTLERAVGR